MAQGPVGGSRGGCGSVTNFARKWLWANRRIDAGRRFDRARTGDFPISRAHCGWWTTVSKSLRPFATLNRNHLVGPRLPVVH
jgi:hypothetical protein